MFGCISKSLSKIIERACSKLKINDVLMVGGVSSNKHVRKYLEENLNCRLYFPEPRYCSDNAVGAALIAMHKHKCT